MIEEDELDYFKLQLKHLEESGNFDVEKYKKSLVFQTGQLEYFYCHIVKDGDCDHAVYQVKNRPEEHSMAYFNIGRGFPKELMDGHWRYVVRDLGTKVLIIPCTSIKKESRDYNPRFEKDIIITDSHKELKSRMQLSDMRMIDIQRLDTRKQFYQVLTPRNEINQFIISRLFDG